MPKGLLRGFLGGLSTGVGQGVAQAGQQYYVNQIMENPNLTPIQKASAVSVYAPEYAKQYLKSAEEQSQLQDFLAGSQQGPQNNLPSRIPQGQERYAAMGQIPTADIPGIGINAPPHMGNQQPQMQQQPTQQGQQGGVFSNLSDDKLKEGIARFGKNPALAGAFKEELADRRAEKKLIAAEIQAERKANESYRSKILNRIPETKKTAAQLDRLEQLNREGVEISPLFKKVTDFFGIPIGAFDSANAQELEKISNDLTAGIQSDYGNRILATEFNVFLKRIPSLMNSKEGRERVIHNLKLYQRAKSAEDDAYRQIYAQQKNSGIKNPIVRQEDVLDRTEPILDEIFAEMNRDLKNENILEGNVPLIPPGTRMILTPDGRRVAVPENRVAEALQQGGKLG